MDDRIYSMFPGIEIEEFQFLKEISNELPEDKQNTFLNLYSGKRKNPEMILITACIGLLGIAGIQRFLVGQIGMGILFLLTVGLCYIGTIVDIVNYKRMALDLNRQMALESMQMVKNFN